MDTFEIIGQNGFEQLTYFRDDSVGLKAVIAIHNTILGPAIGGVRMMNFPDQEAGVREAVELAKEMTLRVMLAGCDLGGASAILWGDAKDKSEAYFRAFGRFINRLSGQFIAIMEVGTDSRDLKNMKRETDYVHALPEAFGGIADPTEMTAEGILHGLKASAKLSLGKASLENLTCLVQGVGRLGGTVVKLLAQEKARILVTDKNFDKIKNIQDVFPEVSMIRPEEVVDTKCDILIPCALGYLVTQKNADRVRAKIIAGGASNILPDVETADLLHKKGVLYVPHMLIDAGELMQADYELMGRSLSLLKTAIGEIYRRTLSLLEEARDRKEPPLRLALKAASDRLTTIGNIGRRVLI